MEDIVEKLGPSLLSVPGGSSRTHIYLRSWDPVQAVISGGLPEGKQVTAKAGCPVSLCSKGRPWTPSRCMANSWAAMSKVVPRAAKAERLKRRGTWHWTVEIFTATQWWAIPNQAQIENVDL